MTIISDIELRKFMESHPYETPIEIISLLNKMDPEYSEGGHNVGASPDLIIKAMKIYKETHQNLSELIDTLPKINL